MNVLILGSGGREHALAWRLSHDTSSTNIYIWPGNDGIEGDKISLVKAPFNKESLIKFLDQHQVELVIPGPEKFLYEGVSDWCEAKGVTCFGPSKSASRLEESKLFSKELMTNAGVPTSRYIDLSESFDRDLNRACTHLKSFNKPVIKISGPSLGKGVFVCDNYDEAREVLRRLKEDPAPGMEDGLLVEEGVSGKEISVFFACNGTKFSYLGSAQDHKRLLEGDKGPNTGGMGAISPVAWADKNFINTVIEKFLVPTLTEMEKKGSPYKGILFLGLMVNGSDMNLLEYNVRFGDPETQVILPLIQGDLTQFLLNFSRGESVSELNVKNEVAVHIVKASRGYPGTFGTHVEKGIDIHHEGTLPLNSKLLFAGVKRKHESLVTDGGRVLGVTAWATTFALARKLAYEALNQVHFEGEHFRKDIGNNL